MVTQILNFGLPSQIDVRTVGYDRETNLRVAQELRRRIAAHSRHRRCASSTGDRRARPSWPRSIERVRSSWASTQQSIANNINTTLSSSEQVTPNFWTDPKSGIPYYIAVQTPEHLGELPERTRQYSGLDRNLDREVQPYPGLLNNVATFTRDGVPTNLNQTNIQPTYEVYASVAGRDLGSVSDDIRKIVAELQRQLSPGNTIQVIGQIQSMNDAFRDLAIGLLFAAVFVYLLMVVNYQNFGDPFVVILALPATLCGILTMLFITGTTLSVPSLDGGDHGGRRRLGEFHSARHVRARAAACRQDRLRGGNRRRAHAYPARVDDRRRDDRRDDPDGDWRCRRGAECRIGPSRHRWAAVRDPDHPAGRPLFVCHAAQEKRRQASARRIRGSIDE